MARILKTARVNEECIERFNELNRGISPQWRLIIFKLNEEESEIIVDHCCDIKSSKDEILNVLAERISNQSPCWMTMKISYETKDGGKRDKTTMISWIPDTIRRDTLKEAARVKMVALGCASTLKKGLKGVSCFIEANSIYELDFDYLLEKASKHERESIVYQMLF